VKDSVCRCIGFQCVDTVLKGANPNLFALGGAMPYSATPVALPSSLYKQNFEQNM